jgi:3-oxoacyl-[acyl-carrier-protein] synthase III
MKQIICFKSYNTELDPDTRYIKMHGRKIYEFALTTVPAAMKSCLDKSGIAIDDVKNSYSSANEKMDESNHTTFLQNCMIVQSLKTSCR